MNRDMLEGHWKQLRGRLQAEYGWLTDDDLDLIDGAVQGVEFLPVDREGDLAWLHSSPVWRGYRAGYRARWG